MQLKRLTARQAMQSVQQYCSSQERCHSEVKDRLYSQGLSEDDVQEIISRLISENFLNEERFARAFARGKFRIKGWGKVKIRYELKTRRVNDHCIRKGLSEIDEDEYGKSLRKYFEQKWSSLASEKNIFTKKKKLLDYLSQKGYERDLIFDMLKHI